MFCLGQRGSVAAKLLRRRNQSLLTLLLCPPGLTEIIKFVKPAPIDQEMAKKAKKQAGGKKKKQEGDLPNAMETMSVNDS